MRRKNILVHMVMTKRNEKKKDITIYRGLVEEEKSALRLLLLLLLYKAYVRLVGRLFANKETNNYSENPMMPTLAMGGKRTSTTVSGKWQLDPMLRGIKNSKKTMSWPVLLFIGG